MFQLNSVLCLHMKWTICFSPSGILDSEHYTCIVDGVMFVTSQFDSLSHQKTAHVIIKRGDEGVQTIWWRGQASKIIEHNGPN